MLEVQSASPYVQIAAPQPVAARQRYVALDAARGFVMTYLCTEGFGLAYLKGSPTADRVASWFNHLRWEGLVPWELVYPAFMFMVGMSLPFALARRSDQGMTFGKQFRHVAFRACVLALLGAVLYSLSAGHYHADPIETLTQIGLSYFCVFLILQFQFRWQIVAAAALMALNWGLFALFPGPTGPFDPTDNIGIRIDRFAFGIDHKYDWQSIEFIGSTVTVLFGAWTAMLVQSNRALSQKLKILLGCAGASLIAALAIIPINPIIHKCYTASFTLVHTCCILLMISFFVWLFDPPSRQRLAFPLVVVGMNSIFIYLVNNGLKGRWLAPSVGVFTMQFRFLGTAGPVVQAWAVFLVMWYLCHWLYSHKIFFKI
jgi:heparan-alpha-glucosaminide N-acetyltransferase